MAVTLYKAGDTHRVNGIKCELCAFDENSFAQYLDLGWHYTPEECYRVEESIEADGVLLMSELSDDEVRLLAKEKGIKFWHNKNIDKLRDEVDAWQPET